MTIIFIFIIPYTTAMKILFGEEILPHHIILFSTLGKLLRKWRGRTAQRKNVIEVEKFANNESQKRAIIKHKEQAVVEVSSESLYYRLTLKN